MRGSILVKYNETPDTRGLANFEVLVNSVVRDLQFTDVNNYYSTFMFVGDVVRFNLVFPGGLFPNLTIYREDYTTNDEAGDNGIKETLIPFSIVSGTTQLLSVEFTGTTVSDAYNFKYVIDCSSGPTPTFYTWSLGYDASNATNACIDYTTSPSTYYTTVPTLQNGIYLYDSNTIFDLAPAGYYSDGTNVWYKSPTTLTLTNQSACVVPTPTPTVLSDCLTTQYLDFSGFTGSPPYVSDGYYNVLNSYTGGTLNYGYVNTSTGLFQPNVIAPNGNKYKVYGFYDGSFFYYNWIRSFAGSTDTGWTIVQTTGGYFSNGFGYYQSYGGRFEGAELTDGTYHYLPSGTYSNVNLTGTSVTIYCVSVTPTPTPTPTVTPSFIGCFNPQPGFGPVTIWNLDIQTDDSILVAGTYNTYNNITYSAIIRLNADATIDNTFNIGTGFNNPTLDVKTQSDGKILVGGDFTSYSGVSANSIIRLNTNGSVDNSFNIGTGFDSPSLVFTIAIQSDGKILVGGIYASYNGTSSNYIIRLNTDGSIDTSFNIGTGFDGGVHTIKIQSDGKILIGGNFTSYNGVSRNRLIRLNQNGTVDVLFNIGSGFSDIVRDIEIQPDGKIILVGEFGNIPSPQYRRIVRLNSDGSIDTTFNAGTGIRGFNNTAYAVDLQSDGKIIVGGLFTTYNNTFSTNRVIRLNTDGSPDNTFNVGTGFNDTIHSLKVLSNNKIILGGQFTSYNGTLVDRIIRLNSNGTEDLCP